LRKLREHVGPLSLLLDVIVAIFSFVDWLVAPVLNCARYIWLCFEKMTQNELDLKREHAALVAGVSVVATRALCGLLEAANAGEDEFGVTPGIVDQFRDMALRLQGTLQHMNDYIFLFSDFPHGWLVAAPHDFLGITKVAVATIWQIMAASSRASFVRG
jgi:hypothetical protein